jgi:phosphohistidine phosphatase
VRATIGPETMFMSRVYLLRHAKAQWPSPGMRDFDRPLEQRGEQAAQAMGKTMAEAHFLPEVIVTSPSRRTKQTLEHLASQLTGPFRLEEDGELFGGAPDAYLSAIRSVENAGSVMLIGHNPMIEDLAIALVGTGEPALVNRLRDGFPTSGLAVIDFDGPLSAVEPAAGTLVTFLRPSDI